MPRLSRTALALTILVSLLVIHQYLPPSSLTQLRSQRSASSSDSTSSSRSSSSSRPLQLNEDKNAWSRELYTHEGTGLAIDHRGLTHYTPGSNKVHPIEALIERGKEMAKELEKKIERVKTVEDSVDDYEEAFGMRPPKGFESWFHFTQLSDPRPPPLASLIPQVHDPFLQFLSLPVHVLRERMIELRSKGSMFSFSLVPDGQGDQGTACTADQNWTPKDYHTRGRGRVKIQGGGAWMWRCNNTLTLILPILPLLPKEIFEMNPPLEIPFSYDDGPKGMVHNTFREKAEALARAGKVWPEAQLHKAEQSMRWTYGWSWACPEGSPLKSRATDLVLNDIVHPKSSDKDHVEKTFIADFERSADYCSDPDLMNYHHILLSEQHRAAVELAPSIATCKTMWNSDIVGVPLDDVFAKVDFMPWEEKKIAKAFWRGTATGLFHNKKTPWRQSQRERLHFLSHNVSSFEDVIPLLLPNNEIAEFTREQLGVYLDVGLTGKPNQCDQEDGTCDEMANEIDFMSRVSKEHSLQYKYVVDVDGNGWSSRFRRLLAGNNVVLKSTLYPEWFHDMLIPWYHYVPLKLDYSDIYDIMAFFVGSPDGSIPGRDDLAKEIAANGRKFVDDRWRLQDMQSFTFLLILEFWRMMSEDRAAASYDI
ncbi:hypothetical protein IAU59_005832 [Kwoniella sp. CBS 9459]